MIHTTLHISTSAMLVLVSVSPTTGYVNILTWPVISVASAARGLLILGTHTCPNAVFLHL